MSAPDPKKIGALVVAGLPPPGKLGAMRKPSGDGPPDEGGDDEEAHAGVSAVRDFFEAGKTGDYEAAWGALSDAMDIADSEDSGDDTSGGDNYKQ